MMFKKICVVLAMVCVLFFPINVMADDNKSNNYNIEVVVDASGSLKKTDSDQNRFTAIDIFLQTLKNGGNYVGAVVFTEEIMVDTGISEMKGNTEKNQLSSQISSINADKGDTNIGLALETAANHLENMDNGLDNVILLISDGNSDLDNPDELNASLATKDAAIQKCITNNIVVYGVCLNNNGEADINEFTDITQKTNGAFLEVKTSDGLVNALRNFYAQIFKTSSVDDNDRLDLNGYLRKAIAVPSFGVEELNITISNASKIQNLALTRPDGVEMTSTELDGISSVIGDYYFIKLTNPDSGTWNLELYGEPNTDIELSYIYNSDYQVELISDSSDNTYSVGENIQLSAYFKQNNEEIVGNDYYKDYSATLVLNFLEGSNENSQYYSMELNDDEGFDITLVYDEMGSYTAYAVLNCGDFEIRSNAINFSVGNSSPVLENDTLTIRKLFSNSKTIDLNDYFNDKEDAELEYELIASSYRNDDLVIDGNKLTLNDLSDGSITIQAIDSNGATINGIINVDVQNFLFIIFIILGVILLGFTAIFLRINYIKRHRMFEGELSVYANSPDVDDNDSYPIQNFTGKLYLRDFCLRNTDFSSDAYFEVIKDTYSNLPKGNFSHKLRFVSPKEFYYMDGGEERKVKSLELSMNMDYVIRSHSEEDCDKDDSIRITLSEI